MPLSKNANAEVFYESMGPWVEDSSLEDQLSVSDECMAQWRSEHRLLGVHFANGGYYYPIRQFLDGQPDPALQRVLTILAQRFEPATIASFLASAVEPGKDQTYWDLLHEGHADMIDWATRTVNHHAA